ncbi:MAG TPA: c-type cytochrome [Phenylobacterium sp.]|nr:c-type cytochrome [Phenylobacterium sp.]
MRLTLAAATLAVMLTARIVLKRSIIALLALLGAAYSAVAAPAANHATSSVDHGRFLVLRACAGCHAVGEAGASPDSHAPTFPVVRGSVSASQLKVMLRELSKNGHYEMPPIFMSEADIRDIAAYIATLRPSAGGRGFPRRAAMRPVAFGLPGAGPRSSPFGGLAYPAI